METKFISQICTTREQSERLLKLGLKKETADMVLVPSSRHDGSDVIRVRKSYLMEEDAIPAWSMHRLIALIPRTIKDMLALCVYNNAVIYDGLGYVKEFKASESLYDNLIDCIAWLIDYEYMYNDYLED